MALKISTSERKTHSDQCAAKGGRRRVDDLLLRHTSHGKQKPYKSHQQAYDANHCHPSRHAGKKIRQGNIRAPPRLQQSYKARQRAEERKEGGKKCKVGGCFKAKAQVKQRSKDKRIQKDDYVCHKDDYRQGQLFFVPLDQI